MYQHTAGSSPARKAEWRYKTVVDASGRFVDPKTGLAWPSQATIAEEAGVCLATARKYLQQAVKYGDISRDLVSRYELQDLTGYAPANSTYYWQKHYVYRLL